MLSDFTAMLSRWVIISVVQPRPWIDSTMMSSTSVSSSDVDSSSTRMSGSRDPGACQGDELALRGGEVVSFLLDDVLELAGQDRQQVPGADRPDRLLDLFVGRSGLRVPDVRGDRALEHERVLGHDAERGRKLWSWRSRRSMPLTFTAPASGS